MPAPTVTLRRARVLRREMTLPEVLLWRDLRRGGCGGLRFRRQHPVGPYVIDFFCAEIRLGVEVDGAAHDGAEQASLDARRDAWLAREGIDVLRFRATDVLNHAARRDVLETIITAARGRTVVGFSARD